jgi:hypothetical protein
MTDLPDHDIATLCDVAADRINAYAAAMRRQIDVWEPRPYPARHLDIINGKREF